MPGRTKIKKDRVLVAMSGGVDSAVAAALLTARGFKVAGVFMHFWSERNLDRTRIENKCCSVESRDDARRVAAQLGIRFYTLNFDRAFKKTVVDPFIKRAGRGITLNPCAYCNREIKFGRLLQKAQALGFDFLATGHYARIKPKNPKTQKPIYQLLKGRDRKKDQSYFLYTLTQAKLEKVLFPVGGYTKTQVRKLARKFGLAVAAKRDSQNLCFISGKDTDGFLQRNLKNIKPGPVKLVNGKIIGRHRGLPLYTIGQRQGLGFGYTAPLYVVGADYAKNTLIVTDREREPQLWADGLIAHKLSWIAGQPPAQRERLKAKIRYLHPELSLKSWSLNRRRGEIKIKFAKKARAVTPGQAVVLYKNDEVLGGGEIKKALNG